MLSKLGIVPSESPLDLPNAAIGLVFYVVLLLSPSLPLPPATRRMGVLAGSLISAAASAYLGYVLAFVLHDFCVVCVTTYIINAAILVMALIDACGSKAKAKTP